MRRTNRSGLKSRRDKDVALTEQRAGGQYAGRPDEAKGGDYTGAKSDRARERRGGSRRHLKGAEADEIQAERARLTGGFGGAQSGRDDTE